MAIFKDFVKGYKNGAWSHFEGVPKRYLNGAWTEIPSDGMKYQISNVWTDLLKGGFEYYYNDGLNITYMLGDNVLQAIDTSSEYTRSAYQSIDWLYGTVAVTDILGFMSVDLHSEYSNVVAFYLPVSPDGYTLNVIAGQACVGLAHGILDNNVLLYTEIEDGGWYGSDDRYYYTTIDSNNTSQFSIDTSTKGCLVAIFVPSSAFISILDNATGNYISLNP